MATDEIDVDDIAADLESESEGQSSKGGSRFSGKKLKIIILLGIFMAVFAGIGFLYGPDKSTGTDTAEIEEYNESSSNVDKVEVVLGDGVFNTTNEYAIVGASIHVKFKVVVTVAKSQENEFRTLINEVHKNRVREAVIEVVRGSSREDLRDPELNVMKRKIREKVNRILGSTAIIDVVFSDYQTMEQ